MFKKLLFELGGNVVWVFLLKWFELYLINISFIIFDDVDFDLVINGVIVFKFCVVG